MLSTRPLFTMRRDDWLNIAWAVLTFVLIGAAYLVWPHGMRSWEWGLLVGAGIGATAVFGVGFAYSAIQRKGED